MLSAGTALGPYQILSQLGVGGMGEVYRARDTRLGRDVAIKVIASGLTRDRDRVRRFEQEARAAGALAHPNVCAVFDIGTYQGAPFIVMEMLEGESMRARLKRGPIPERKAIDYVAQAAHGLAAAHKRGIVHRDLKPENLFLTNDGRVKVLDFGLAKLMRPDLMRPEEEDTITICATEIGATMGTIGYMAPEQVRGDPADHRADVFALGAILYELLTGKRAFVGATTYEISHRILNEDPPPLSASGRAVPPSLAAIMHRCLEKRPEERFQNAEDLSFALVTSTSEEMIAQSIPARRGLRSVLARNQGRCLAASALLGVVAATALITAIAVKQNPPVSQPKATTFVRLKIEKGNVVSARFSANGSSVVFSGALSGRPAQVFEIQPQSPASRPLGPANADLLSVSSNGTMAIAIGAPNYQGWPREGTLAELPTTGGAPHFLLEHVCAADWLPGGEDLAVVRHVDNEYWVEMPIGNVVYRSANPVLNVRAAPSGKWLALSDGGAGPARVIVVGEDGVLAARSDVWPRVRGLAWSADGKEVWYSTSPNMWSCDIRAMAIGGKQRVVSSSPGLLMVHDIGRDGRVLLARESVHTGIRGCRGLRGPEQELGWLDWSWLRDIAQDGKTIVFTEEQASATIFLRAMDGSPAVKLGDGIAPALSPDGKWVLTVDRGPPRKLRLLPTGVGEALALPPGNVNNYYSPKWRPDGMHIVFVGVDSDGSRNIYTQDLVGGLPRSIMSAEHSTIVLVSPDGRRIAFKSGDASARAVAIDSALDEEVIALQPDDELIQWTSDGRGVFALESGGASRRIVRIDWTSGRREFWRLLSAPDSVSCVIHNVMITPDGEDYAYTYIHRLNELFVAEGI